MEMRGYEQILSGFKQGLGSRKNTSLDLLSEEVVVLDRHAAMHLAKFTNTMTLANDSILKVAGHWSAVFKKINGQWKVVHVHESYNEVKD